jgi:hypothetical protein
MCTFVDPGATTNANPFAIELPWPPADIGAEIGGLQFYYHGASRGFDLPAGGAYGAVGIIKGGTGGPVSANTISLFATAGSAAWNNLTPFTWNGGEGDGFTYFFDYEAADAEDDNYVTPGLTFVSCGVWT